MKLFGENSRFASLSYNAMAVVGVVLTLTQWALWMLILPIIAADWGQSLNVVTFPHAPGEFDVAPFICVMLCAIVGLLMGAGTHNVRELLRRGHRREARTRCFSAGLSWIVSSGFLFHVATHNLPSARNSGALLNIELHFGALLLTLLSPALALLLTSLLLSRQDARTAPVIAPRKDPF